MFPNRLFAVILAGSSFLASAQAQPVTIQEDFSSDPAGHGWRAWGDTSLFAWNSTNHTLDVTWDSSQTNSYFYHPLGAVLHGNNDFTLSFDLDLSGVTDISGYGFELGIGLCNLADATSPTFLRGTGANSPNLVEFDYFPDDGSLPWGPSVTAVMVDNSGIGWTNWSSGGFSGIELATGSLFHIQVAYTGADQTLRTTIFQNGSIFATVPDATVGPGFQGFNVDTLAVESYSGLNSGGSLLAWGAVGNILFTAAPPPVALVTGGFDPAGAWQVQCLSYTNWVYTLERTTDFVLWTPLTSGNAGTGGSLALRDPNPPADKAFYRVSAARP